MVNFSVVMRFIDSASRPLRRIQETTNQMADSSERMSSQIKAANTALFAFAAAVDFAVVGASASAIKLEQSLARLATVTRTTTKTQESALADAEFAARRFSENFTASANEIIRAQFQLATAGIPVEEQIVGTQAAFKLAQATMGDFTNAAQLLGSFLNTFGKTLEFSYLAPAEKMEAITDRLSTAVQRFQVTLPVLAESFKFIVGPASQLNLKLGEVTAAIGVLNTAGFRGTLAGTALSNMFNKLDRAVDKLNLNPEKFIDLNGNLKNLVSFLEEVNRALSDKTPIEAQNKLIETFDIRAGRVAKTLLNNIQAIKKFSAELEVSRGATDRMAQTMQQTTQSELKKMVNSFTNLFITIGQQFLPVIRVAATILNKVAQSFERVVRATGPVLPGMLALGASILTLVSGLKLLSFGLGIATRAWQIYTLAVQTATGVTRAALILTGIGAALVALSLVIEFGGAAIDGFLGTLESLNNLITGETTKTLDQLQKEFAGVGTSVSRAAQEIDRVNKIIESGLRHVFIGEDLGDLPITNRIEQLVKAGVELDKAGKKAFKEAGGFKGVAKQFGESFGLFDVEIKSMVKNFEEMREASDRSFKGMSESAKAAEFAQDVVAATDLAFRSFGDGAQETGKILKTVADNAEVFFQALFEGDRAARSNTGRILFENFQQSLEVLRKIDIKPIQDMVALFDSFKARGEVIDFDSDEFREAAMYLRQINRDVRNVIPSANEFRQLIRAAGTAMDQADRAAKSVVNILKSASLQAGDLPKAFEESGQRIKDAEDSVRKFQALLPKLEEGAKKFKEQFGKTPEFKDLEKIIDTQRQITAELLVKIDDTKIAREGFRIIKIIAEQFGRLPVAIQKDIKRVGDIFTSTLKRALTGELRNEGQTAFQALAKDFRKEFVSRVVADLRELLAPEFTFGMQKAIDAARGIMENAFKSGSLFEQLETGELTRKINEAVRASAPELQKLLGGDVLQLDKLSKIEESFKKIGTDVGVAIVNAGAKSASLLEQLQDVLSTGPAKGLADLNRQADELRRLLREAGRTGADTAIRPIEAALKAVLDRLATGGPAHVARSIAQESARASQSLQAASSAFATAVSTVVPAARQFVSIVTEGFNRLTSNVENIKIEDKAKTLELKVSAGTRRFEFSIDKTASGITTEDALDEDEIRKIIEEVRDELKQEQDEILRKLEDELRKK